MMHANFTALCFIGPELLPLEVLHRGNRDFLHVLLLWPWPWPDDLHIRTPPVFQKDYTGCAKMNFLRQSFRKLSSDRHTYIQTDTTEITVCVKKVAPPSKTFSDIFTQAKYIFVKFFQFVASIYPHKSTNFGQFILIFNKMALIILGVLIVFTVSSSSFSRLPWLHR